MISTCPRNQASAAGSIRLTFQFRGAANVPKALAPEPQLPAQNTPEISPLVVSGSV